MTVKVPLSEVLANRETLFFKHPLMTNKVVLHTPLLESLKRHIFRLSILRAPGCWTGAPTGFGKSTALTYLYEELPKMNDAIQCLRYDGVTESPLAEKPFHQRIALMIGITDLRGDSSQLRRRVTESFIELARIRGRPLIILLVDETQVVKHSELYFLKDIANAFHRDGEAQLVTILAGQEPQMRAHMDSLCLTDKYDLNSRFAQRPLPFPAYATEEDFEGLLAAIDKARYPEDSAVTWTQFFFPTAWQRGFRLKGQSRALMRALQLVTNLKPGIGYPIREVMLGIRYYCTEYGEKLDGPVDLPPEDAWVESFKFALVAAASAHTSKLLLPPKTIEMTT